MQKRNLDIVDSIYEKADKRTMNQLSKLTSIDDHGVKHRLKEKTLAEENLEKVEKIVKDQYAMNLDLMKHVNVTEITNKAFVTEDSKINQEKLKGRFDLRINHALNMNKKIEIYANDDVAFFLHKNRNFIKKLVHAKQQIEHEKRLVQ